MNEKLLVAHLQEEGMNAVDIPYDEEFLQCKTPFEQFDELVSQIQAFKYTPDICAIYCTFENNYLRAFTLAQAQALGYITPDFIHEKAIVSPQAKRSYGPPIIPGSPEKKTKPEPGNGIYVYEGAVVMPYVEIGNFSIISPGVNAAHHAKLGEGVCLSNGVNFGVGAVARNFVSVGIGATIMDGKNLGKACIVRAGAVVTRNVPARATAVGNSAKILKDVLWNRTRTRDKRAFT